MTYAIWAIAAAACILGWVVVYEEIRVRATWRYRLGLVALWASVTWIVGSWPLR